MTIARWSLVTLGDAASWSNGREEILKWQRQERHEEKETMSSGNAFLEALLWTGGKGYGGKWSEMGIKRNFLYELG